MGRVPSSIPAVLAGTVEASIDRCRSSSQSPLFSACPVGQASLRSLAPPLPIKPASLGFDGVPRASIPYGRLLPLYFCTSRPGGWLKAIETAQGSGSGKRSFACSQTGRRSIERGSRTSNPLSFGSNPFSFRKENGFAPVGRPDTSSPATAGETLCTRTRKTLFPVREQKATVAGAIRLRPPAGGEPPFPVREQQNRHGCHKLSPPTARYGCETPFPPPGSPAYRPRSR